MLFGRRSRFFRFYVRAAKDLIERVGQSMSVTSGQTRLHGDQRRQLTSPPPPMSRGSCFGFGVVRSDINLRYFLGFGIDSPSACVFQQRPALAIDVVGGTPCRQLFRKGSVLTASVWLAPAVGYWPTLFRRQFLFGGGLFSQP